MQLTASIFNYGEDFKPKYFSVPNTVRQILFHKFPLLVYVIINSKIFPNMFRLLYIAIIKEYAKSHKSSVKNTKVIVQGKCKVYIPK
jgi:hypothetical protein